MVGDIGTKMETRLALVRSESKAMVIEGKLDSNRPRAKVLFVHQWHGSPLSVFSTQRYPKIQIFILTDTHIHCSFLDMHAVEKMMDLYCTPPQIVPSIHSALALVKGKAQWGKRWIEYR